MQTIPRHFAGFAVRLERKETENAVSLLNLHFVFVPKRRKPVLVSKVAERLQEVIFEVVVKHRWRLIALK
jgi:putative transposase